MPASHACMYVWRQTYCMRVYAYKIEFITIMNTYGAFMCNLPSDDRAWSLWIMRTHFLRLLRSAAAICNGRWHVIILDYGLHVWLVGAVAVAVGHGSCA